MATHSSTLAWKIPWTEQSGGLQSMGLRRVGHDWATLLSLFTFMHWRRKWQPPPVFLPGESQGRGSLVGCRLWGHTESDTTEAMQQQQSLSRGGLFHDPRTAAHHTLLSMGFARQEYCSELLFRSAGDLSQPRDQTCVSCIEGRFFTTEPPGKSTLYITLC